MAGLGRRSLQWAKLGQAKLPKCHACVHKASLFVSLVKLCALCEPYERDLIRHDAIMIAHTLDGLNAHISSHIHVRLKKVNPWYLVTMVSGY